MKRLLLPAAVLLVAATSASLAWTAGRAAPPPPVIATVDVSRVFQALNERNARIAELEARSAELRKGIAELENRLKSEKSAYDVLPDGAEKQSKRQVLQRLVWQLEIETKLAQKTVDDLEAEMMRNLYLKIDDAAAKVARANGYTIVLASDEASEIPEQNVNEIMRVIALKRMLYVDPRHDISDELILFMNNEFGPGPAAKK